MSEPAQEDYRYSWQEGGLKGFLFELVRRFNADQCGVWAAALSYFALLSIVPLLVGGLALVGLLIRDPQEAAAQVQGLVARLLPVSNANAVAQKLIVSAGVEQQAEQLRQASGTAGILSLVTFFFTASRIFVNAVAPMNAAFRARETRHFLQVNLVAVGLLIGTGALFLLSLLPTVGVHWLRRISWFSALPEPPPWWLAAFLLLVGVALNASVFAAVYHYLPSPAAGVTWKEAFIGGGFVAVFFELAKQGFALYLRNFNGGNSYDRAYGSLGIVAILFLWIYVSSQLLLLGAELIRLIADTTDKPVVRQKNSDVITENG
ncbi:MAG: YihY/virulence factor BrkB family protein [Capsulimonadales bacterium]|nr:YihY/virulence factor BrkB family protein [Capsulimonadales bacterium]